jgi:hypothetical protein
MPARKAILKKGSYVEVHFPSIREGGEDYPNVTEGTVLEEYPFGFKIMNDEQKEEIIVWTHAERIEISS